MNASIVSPGGMTTRLLLVAGLLLITAGLVAAQPQTTLVPYLSPGYRYIQVPWGGIPGFESPSYPDTSWSTGMAGFGSLGGCPLNTPAFITTAWTPNTDILVRKTLLLPRGTTNLQVRVAIDNDVQVFINGYDISGGLRTHEGCAARDTYTFTAPDSILRAGDNLLAVRGRDRGVEAYLDATVIADVPQILIVGSTADGGPGSLREAITLANANPAPDSIRFAIATEAVASIAPTSPLPALTAPVVIDGTTQPGYAGLPLIELSGALAGEGAAGLQLLGGLSTVSGIAVNRWSGGGIVLGTGGGNTVIGTFVGVDPTGTTARPNGVAGIAVTAGSAGNIIGPGNVISGNNGAGIMIGGDKSTPAGNLIRGNRIGLAVTGDGALPNTAQGVLIVSGSGSTVGGTAPADANTIAGNLSDGVRITLGSGNAVLGNAIYGNGGLGIDLNGDGVTPNALPGTADGANNRQNFPVLSFAASDLQGVAGTLRATPSTPFRIEFFRNTVADPSGYGEGLSLLGSAVASTDSSGNAAFYAGFSGLLVAGEYVTATATDPQGNTSEFSTAVLVTARAKVFGDHYVVNTTLSGIPLHWQGGNGSFSVSAGVPAPFSPEIVQGYGAWSDLPRISLAYAGTTPSTTWGGDPDGINNNVWVTSGWEALTGADQNVIAVTRVRYNALNGQITDADIAYDAEHFTWQVGGAETAGMDVRNVTTHEAGHANGLGDIYDPGDPGYVPAMGSGNAAVTMYGLIASGETSKQTLETPDTAGIGYIYRTIPPDAVDLVLLFDGSPGYSVTQQAFDASVNSALALIPRLRPTDRLAVVKMPNTVVFPLTSMQDSAARAGARSALNALLPGGLSAIGSGLQAAQSLLGTPSSSMRAPAVILYSAGEENASPGALSVLGGIASAGTRVFTMGFPGSTGEGLCNTIADSTGGAYYQASRSTIGPVVNQIWNTLTGQQFAFFTVASSDTFQNVPQPGIAWQGPVDKGTTTAQPGIQWQGPTKAVLAGSPEALPSSGSYVLSLLAPGGSTLIDSGYVAAHPELGIRFFSGPSYQYFTISRPTPGNWTLYVYSRQPPSQPESVAISIAAYTDITMDAGFDRIAYAPGQPVAMNVALARGGQSSPDRHTTGGEPILDASVSAEVRPPGGGQPVIIPFANLGGGIYRGAFAGTLAGGTYNVRFFAVADSVERTSDQAFYVVPPFDGRQVLLATNSIIASERLKIRSGDVIVNGRRRGPSVMPEMVIGERAETPAGFNLKANRILIGRRSTVGSTVFYNQLQNRGTITGGLITPLAIPVLPALPPFKPATPGSSPITIGTSRTQILPPGTYGDLVLQPRGTLRLSGGTYHFRSIWAKTQSKITCDAPTDVRVAKEMRADNRCYIGPAQGSVIDAGDIVFYVTGTPEPVFCPRAVTLGPDGTVFANIATQLGTIVVKEDTRITGALIADDILLGEDVDLTLENAFGTSAPGPVTQWDQEPEDAPDAQVPATYALQQNYPNPFNPTTAIRYEIAEPQTVILSVYDILGRTVRTLVGERQEAGSYQVTWDGRNDSGQPVGSGIFYYRLQAGSFVQTRAMTLLK